MLAGFGSFLYTVGLCIWIGFGMIAGTLTVAVLWAWPGLTVWFLLNFGVAIFLNNARKAQRSEIYDDRLSSVRMTQAFSELTAIHLQARKEVKDKK